MTSAPPHTESTAAIAVAQLTPEPTSRSRITNTISGSTRGWIKRDCGTGSPIGRIIASVSHATSGTCTPIRCCFALLVKPSFTPTSVSPRASRASRFRSWIS
jgi:hypothetical protein